MCGKGELDGVMHERAEAAAAEGCVLRYVASIDNARCDDVDGDEGGSACVRVGVRALPAASALGQLKGTGNLLEFQTRCLRLGCVCISVCMRVRARACVYAYVCTNMCMCIHARLHRYFHPEALVVRGAGAGADNTASGVLADIAELACSALPPC